MTLHVWQKDCLKAWVANGYRGIAAVATGAGKTVLALAAILRLQEAQPSASLRSADLPLQHATVPGNLSVRIVVPRVFLAQQWQRSLVELLGVNPSNIGLIGGGNAGNPSLPFTIYVLDSARTCISRHIIVDSKAGRTTFLICDEVHHFGSQENSRVFEFVPHVSPRRWFALGLSATPDAEHLDDVIIPALGPVIFSYGIDDASRHGITASYRLFRIAVPFDADERDEYEYLSELIARVTAMLASACRPQRLAQGAAFIAQLRSLSRREGKVGQLARKLSSLLLRRKAIVVLAQARIDCAVELARCLLPRSNVLFFTERILTADRLHARLDALFPARVGRYHSNLDPVVKSRTLEAFRTGELRAIVCCRALDEGLDVPHTDVGIIVSAASNPRQRIQRLGRILRKGATDKPKRIFYLYIPQTTEPKDLLIASPDVRTASKSDKKKLSVGHPSLGDPSLGDPFADDLSAGDLAPVDLTYSACDGTLGNPDYNRVADRVLQNLRDDGASERQVKLATTQIARGAIACDWHLSEPECLLRLAQATRAEKPYFQTMLLMIRASKRKD
jgi:superfamily II DNA or RNA helicase